MEKLKVLIWRILHLPGFRFKYWLTRSERRNTNILNSWETIEYILKNKCSVCRYGDGELQMLSHYLKKGSSESFNVDTFQSYNEDLSKRLVEVFQSTNENILICLPYQFKKSSISKLGARIFWEREWLGRKNDLFQLGLSGKYGDTNFTRFYLDRLDILNYPEYIDSLKQIWREKEVIIVEGEYSRLGIGNDLFSEVADIKRVICPATNAFDKYDQILETVSQFTKNKLILIALGHTATVLAFDLAHIGYHALDIGHVDIEYEWYKLGARKKIAIPNKYVNEVSSGRIQTSIDDELYQKQITHIIS
ncbi:SP_1767 family glycosyltransferase [Elizabethkingia meningoseptica]